MGVVTVDEIITSIRELTFDRFVIPAFVIKQMLGYTVSITRTTELQAGSLVIHKTADANNNNDIIVDFSVYKTLDELMDFLISKNIVVAYSAFFRDTVSVEELLPCANRSLSDEDQTIFRKYFFLTDDIKQMMVNYYWRVLDCTGVKTIEDITNDLVGLLKRPSEQHLVLWVAYWIVDKRRMYEMAAKKLGLTFTDGTDYDSTSDVGNSVNTSVNIGSVFTITENTSDGDTSEDFYLVGSDNVWGDKYSFWYRLQCYLRDLLEQMFGDHSLRKDQVIQGYVELSRELDFRSYYDSYPFTLSPLSRGITSKTP